MVAFAPAEIDRPISQRDTTIAVVVSDATPISCELLTSALKHGHCFSVVASASTSRDLYDALVSMRPDVALISLRLADGAYAGLKVLRKIELATSRTRSVMIVDSSEPELVTGAFRLGARGVFCRSSSLRLLSKCISAVHRGQFWASSAELEYVLNALQVSMPLTCVNHSGDSLLTRREQEFLPLVASGLTNRDISEKLKISEHTVKNHLFRIYDKLGISSRAELILYATSRQAPAEDQGLKLPGT